MRAGGAAVIIVSSCEHSRPVERAKIKGVRSVREGREVINGAASKQRKEVIDQKIETKHRYEV